MAWLGWLFLIIFGGIGLISLASGGIQGIITAVRRGPIAGAATSWPSAIFGLVFLLAGIGAFVLIMFGSGFAQPATEFMRALKADDYPTAYELLNRQLQGRFDGKEGFAAWAESLQVKRFTFFSMCSNLQYGRANGQGRFEDNERFYVTIYTNKAASGWKIEGIFFWADSLEGSAGFAGSSNGMDCSD